MTKADLTKFEYAATFSQPITLQNDSHNTGGIRAFIYRKHTKLPLYLSRQQMPNFNCVLMSSGHRRFYFGNGARTTYDEILNFLSISLETSRLIYLTVDIKLSL